MTLGGKTKRTCSFGKTPTLSEEQKKTLDRIADIGARYGQVSNLATRWGLPRRLLHSHIHKATSDATRSAQRAKRQEELIRRNEIIEESKIAALAVIEQREKVARAKQAIKIRNRDNAPNLRNPGLEADKQFRKTKARVRACAKCGVTFTQTPTRRMLCESCYRRAD